MSLSDARVLSVLTIAGSDSGGGAGIQADLKTFAAHGLHGLSAIAALTAQNTRGVTAVHVPPMEFLRAQIDACFDDFRIGAVKLGMLATAEVIHAVADALESHHPPFVVLDPVMVATSGARLLEPSALQAMRSRLIPLATLITPNADEATVLTDIRIDSPGDMRRAAEKLMEMGARSVLLKGGHVRTKSGAVVDLLFDGEFSEFSHPRIDTTSTHGTGCTLSAAIAANLALGSSLHDAVAHSIDFVHDAIATAPKLGSGNGPLNHFAGSDATNSRTSA